MRVKKLLEFASWLARRRGKFNMGDGKCCIAGYALKWRHPDKDYWGSPADLESLFGLTMPLAHILYVGGGGCERRLGLTRMDAVRALRNVAQGKQNIWEC